MKILKLKGIRCKSCNPNCVIYSRSRHDFRWCPGQHVAVDGGTDYFKAAFNDGVVFEEVELDIPVTPLQLYQDWNTRTDKYGLIIEGKKERKLRNPKL